MEPETLARADSDDATTGEPPTLKNYIGGEWVESAATELLGDVDPATGGDACVVDQHVQAIHGLAGLGHHTPHAVFVGHVGHAARQPGQCRPRLGQGGFVDVADEDMGTGVEETACHDQADAAGAGRDQYLETGV